MKSNLNNYRRWTAMDEHAILKNHVNNYHKKKEKWEYHELVSPVLFFKNWEDVLTVVNIKDAISKLNDPSSFLELNKHGIKLKFDNMCLLLRSEEEVSKTRDALRVILDYLKNKE